jgi:hypothetical protein
MLEALARLTEHVERLLAAHEQALLEVDRLRAQEAEDRRHLRQLEERLAQALKRGHELEQERAGLRERLAALPDPASLEEARRRLAALLETLEI